MGNSITNSVCDPAIEKSLAGNKHFLRLNFGIFSLKTIPTVRTLTDSVSFTARYLDNLYLDHDDVLILHYKSTNGLVQSFQIIDSISTWRALDKRKRIKIINLYAVKVDKVLCNSDTFKHKDKKITFCHKADCPRCGKKTRKKESKIHACPNCKTLFIA